MMQMYDYSLVAALSLLLFFAVYFLVAKTPDKPILAVYVRSRRIMGLALLVLACNYIVHLFVGVRFLNHTAAILLNISTYFLAYWLFSSAFIILLDRGYLTARRVVFHMLLLAALPRSHRGGAVSDRSGADSLRHNSGHPARRVWGVAFGEAHQDIPQGRPSL